MSTYRANQVTGQGRCTATWCWWGCTTHWRRRAGSAREAPPSLPRSAVQALLDTVAHDRQSKRQTDWAERDLALILTSAAGRFARTDPARPVHL